MQTITIHYAHVIIETRQSGMGLQERSHSSGLGDVGEFGIITANAGGSLSLVQPGPKEHNKKGPMVELQEQAEARTQTALCAKLKSCNFILIGNGQLLKNFQQGSDLFRFTVQREDSGRNMEGQIKGQGWDEEIGYKVNARTQVREGGWMIWGKGSNDGGEWMKPGTVSGS